MLNKTVGNIILTTIVLLTNCFSLLAQESGFHFFSKLTSQIRSFNKVDNEVAIKFRSGVTEGLEQNITEGFSL